MKLALDLHLHTCLSPCGGEEMTPNNVVNMAYLKGIDIIAVTDHNSALNLPACEAVARTRGIALLPGLEVTTREEVHCLCYFDTVDRALAFSERLGAHLGPVPNVPPIFGHQWVMDEDDRVTREEPIWLAQATDLSLDALVRLSEEAGGVAVPAHINRGSNGLLTNLGFLPPRAGFAALEVWPDLPVPAGDLSGYPILHASDAHRLEDIREPFFYLDLPEKSAQAVMAFLREGRDAARAKK